MKKTILLLCVCSLLAGCATIPVEKNLQQEPQKITVDRIYKGLSKQQAYNLEERVEQSGLDVDLDSNNSLDVDRGGHNSSTAAGARTNLGLAIGTDVQAYDADLTTYAGITPSADVQTMLGSADNSAIRSNIGLAIGTNVQAYDTDLSSLAAGVTGPVVGAGNAGGYAAAAYTDIVTLWASGICTGYLKNDGTCDTETITDPDIYDAIGTVWLAAPTGDDLVAGMLYWADNDEWDPNSVSGTDHYQTLWTGTDWVAIMDINGNMLLSGISESLPIVDADGTGSLTWSQATSAGRTMTYPGDYDSTFVVIPSTGGLSASWAAGTGPWKSIVVHPGVFRTDGTNCGAISLVQVNSGPWVHYTACADAAGTIDFTIPSMPDNWDGGDVFVEMEVFSVQATPSGTIEFEVSIQARGNDEAINSTWVTTNGNIYFEDAETTATTVDTQYDFFRSKNKTAMAAAGAGGDALFVRLTRDDDDATHNTSTQSINVKGVKVYYQIDEFDEKD